jgi:hypothetical protein
LAPESSAADPLDGYSTLSGGSVIDSGLVGSLSDTDPDADAASLLPPPEPLHYEHGLPDGYRKAKKDEFPGVELPTCTTDYEQGDPVNDESSLLPITCDGGDPGDLVFNYDFVDGLRIHPAVLTVKPKHLRVPYGTDGDDIDYDFTIRGFKLGEDASVLTSAVSCTSDYPTDPPWPDAATTARARAVRRQTTCSATSHRTSTSTRRRRRCVRGISR